MNRLNSSIILPLLVVSILLSVSPAKARESNIQQVESALLTKAARNIEEHRKADAVITFQSQSPELIKGTEVQITQTTHDFLFGAIIFDLVRPKAPYKPDLLKQHFKELFNFAIFPFYWNYYEPQQGMTKWPSAIPIIQWCRENGITTKGHPLVWTHPAGVPKWLSQYSVETTEELLRARVINIVGGFKGQIDIWDVVNEPVNTRTWLNTKGKAYMREPVDSIADYCEKALRWAHQGNPEAHLILNEFNVIWESGFNKDPNRTIRRTFIELIKELKKRNTPLSGLGIQAHEPRECWFPPAETVKTFDQFAELGYPLHITEFIPQSGGKEITGGWRKGKWTLETQTEFAEQFYRLAFGHPAVVSISWWGVSDRRIWLPGGGLLTEEYEPKPVYNNLKKLIHEEWKTKIATQTNDIGRVKFRGFYGKYEIKLKTADGRTHTFNLHLNKEGAGEFAFEVK